MMFLKVMYDFTCINFVTVSQKLPLELAVGIVFLKFQVTLTRILFRVFVHRSPLLSTITRTTSTFTRSLNYMKTSTIPQVMSRRSTRASTQASTKSTTYRKPAKRARISEGQEVPEGSNGGNEQDIAGGEGVEDRTADEQDIAGGDSLEDNADVDELQQQLIKLKALIEEKKAQSRKGTRGDQPEREIDFKAITAAAQHIPKLARLPKSNFAIWERHVMDVAYAKAWPIASWRGKGDWDEQEETDLKARRARKEAFFLLTYTLDNKLLHLKTGLRAGDAKGLMKKIDALFKSYTLDALERATDAFRNTSMAALWLK